MTQGPDLEAGTAVHTLTGHHGEVWAVAVTPDGHRAVTGGSDGTVRVWNLTTGKQIAPTSRRLPPWPTRSPGYSINSLSISADGRRAVSGGSDGTVRVWDVAQGVELASFATDSAITVLAGSQPGTRVIAGSGAGPVHLLELCAYEHSPGA